VIAPVIEHAPANAAFPSEPDDVAARIHPLNSLLPKFLVVSRTFFQCDRTQWCLRGAQGFWRFSRYYGASWHEFTRHRFRINRSRRETDFEVCGEAVDGTDAVSKAKELSPDLIILDVRMPGLNGIEVAGILRRALPRIRIVLVTMFHRRRQGQCRDVTRGGTPNSSAIRYANQFYRRLAEVQVVDRVPQGWAQPIRFGEAPLPWFSERVPIPSGGALAGYALLALSVTQNTDDYYPSEYDKIEGLASETD
jgi:CheY-like chemotaxis protein